MDLWPELDKINSVETPKKILEKQAEYLSKKTNGVVYAICEEQTRNMLNEQVRQYDFKYDFSIASKNLEDYRFKVFSVYHNIILYPLLIVMGTQVANDIGMKKKTASNKEEFEDALKLIFSSKVIEDIVSTLMNI